MDQKGFNHKRHEEHEELMARCTAFFFVLFVFFVAKNARRRNRGWPKILVEVFSQVATVNAMIDTRVNTTGQLNMIQRVEQALAQLLADASRRGFYGEAGLTMSIQDGSIQHVRVAIERMIK